MQQFNFTEMILCKRVIDVELVCWRHILSEVPDKSSLPKSASDNLRECVSKHVLACVRLS